MENERELQKTGKVKRTKLNAMWNKYWNPTIESDRISFRSKTLGFLVGCLVGFGFSAIVGSYLGIGWDDQFDEGTWLVLGGFTIWIPTSGLILPIIFAFFIKSLLVGRNITIGGDQSEIIIGEKKLGISRKPYIIQRSEIRVIDISRRLGLNIIWLVPFGIHMFFLLTNGLGLLFNPNTFGYGIANGFAFTIAGIIDLMLIIIIVIAPPTVVKIHTNKEIYRFSFYHKDKKNNLHNGIEHILGNQNLDSNTDSREVSLEKISFIKSGWVEILSGILLILLAIISYIFKIFAGNTQRFSMILLGVILISLGFLNPLNEIQGRKRFISYFAPESENFGYQSHNPRQKEFFLINSGKSSDFQIIHKPYWGSPLVPILISIIIILTGWTQTLWFRFLPRNNLQTSLIWKSVINVLLNVLTLVIFLIISLRVGNRIVTKGNTGKISKSIYPLEIIKMEKSQKRKHYSFILAKVVGLFVLGIIIAFF